MVSCDEEYVVAVLCRIETLQLCWPGAMPWTLDQFVIEAGHCYRLYGSNGVGKSTWLQALSGLLPSTLKISWFLQNDGSRQPAFFSALSVDRHARLMVSDVVSREFLLRQGRPLSAPMRQKLLSGIGMSGLDRVSWCCLSSGQRQLVQLLPLWYVDHAVWLLDEPWGSLDLSHRLLLEQVLNRHLGVGGAVLVVSHDDFDLALKNLHLQRGGV